MGAGGLPCLDFVNTLAWRATEAPEERLPTYADLVSWSEREGLATRARGARLLRRAARDPREAEATLAKARALRESLYRLFTKFRRGGRSAARDVNALNRFLSRTPARRTLVPGPAGFAWGVEGAERLDSILWPLLWSAADLLVDEARERVKMCAGLGCGSVFYDGSRNRSRRWCSMSDCGNREKARRHYLKLKRKR